MGSVLQWRHNGCDSFSNHQPHDCLLKGSFRCRSTKTWKLCVTGLCAGNSPGTGEFLAQMASNAEDISIWWCHHGKRLGANQWVRSHYLKQWQPTSLMPYGHNELILNCLIFQKKHENVFIKHIIPLRCQDTGSLKSSSCKIRKYLFYIANFMAADAWWRKEAGYQQPW